jgi:dTDP-4-dehydrorhamnose 3,5-epimerase
MATETFKSGVIQGVVVRDLQKYVDERGWLAELFRHDELEEEFHPQMAYVSQSEPQVQRGPHEHADQADLFYFIGPSSFKIRLWDNRPHSETYRNMMTLFSGEDDPKSVLVPKGVVHVYRNVGHNAGIVLNFPNRLFKGVRRSEEIDEIRYEDDPNTIFRLDD